MSESFLKALSAPQPVPGGGAAAAYGASVGLALLEKITRLEIRRDPSSPERESFWSDSLARASRLTEALSRFRDEDGRTYMKWAEAKSSGGDRTMLNRALQEAIECPMNIMRTAHEALECVFTVSGHCKRHLLPDLMVVCELLQASAKGVYYIALSNLRLTDSASLSTNLKGDLHRLHDEGHALFLRVEEAILARAGMEEEAKHPDVQT